MYSDKWDDGKLHYNLLRTSYVKKLVKECWDAALLDPSWGSREQVTIKLLCSAYGESHFNRYCVNINRNKSIDRGILQINSCNLPIFKNWCIDNKLKYKIDLLYDYHINIVFAAYLNEWHIKKHQRVYRYQGKPDQARIYRRLCKLIDDVPLETADNTNEVKK